VTLSIGLTRRRIGEKWEVMKASVK
jgi:hypothetical protein